MYAFSIYYVSKLVNQIEREFMRKLESDQHHDIENKENWKSSLAIYLHYFIGAQGGEFDTYRNPTQYDERQHSSIYRRDNLARGVSDVLEKKLGTFSDKKILDLGAGTGILSLEIAQRGPSSVTAFDLFPLPLERLQNKAKTQDLSSVVEAIQGDMNAPFPFAESTFDAVISLRANRFIHNFSVWLQETRKVLKPSGLFVLPVFPIDFIPWKRHSDKGIFQETGFRSISQSIQNEGFIIDPMASKKYTDAVEVGLGNRDVPFYYQPSFIVANSTK